MTLARWPAWLFAALAAVVVTALLTVPGVGHAAPALLSQGHSASSSSSENATFPASSAVDGDSGTRWSSQAADPQWLAVDLGGAHSLSQVVLNWEAAYAKAFQIQVSTDNVNWTNLTPVTAGNVGVQTLSVSGTGRYVRMYGTQRATQWGYSLWEFQVYGDDTAAACNAGVNSALNQPVLASSTQDAGAFPASSAVDGNPGTRWSSVAADPQWIRVDLGSVRQVCGVELDWEAAFASSFQIQVSTDGNSWSNLTQPMAGLAGNQTLTVNGSGRYVRMNGAQRATQWGYSLWEFIIHTVGAPPTTTTTTQPPQGDCPWVKSTAPVAQRVDQLMAAMTNAQKVVVLHGNGATGPYIGNTDPIPALCVPAMGLQDGPAGVGDSLDGVTELPDPTALAATWDVNAAKQYGTVMGQEFAGKGANVVLGPTINIVRDPRWGRDFETYSEDPYHAGQTAVGAVQGIQGQGVMAQVKHAAAYNVEGGASRGTPSDNVIIDDRTLHEIYLPAFQTVLTQGQAASVMCAYNQINGTPACQDSAVMNTALKQATGWDGFIGSDWGSATGGAPQLANGGLDMEMPGGAFFGQALIDAVNQGKVSQSTLDDMTRRVLTQMFKFGLFDHGATGNTGAVVTSAAHTQVAQDVAAQGSVLLKNNGVLPLSASSLKSIALLGGDAIDPQNIGGGSAKVNPSPAAVNPINGITKRAGSGVSVQWVAGAGEHVQTPDIPAAVALAQKSDVAVVFASYGESETDDLSSIDLQFSQNDLISAVAAANPRTIVVLNTGSAVTMPWLTNVAGVIEGWYPGQENGDAIASLLFGDVNPSGKLPVTFPRSMADMPTASAQQFPGANDRIEYSEGMNVGYRWYDARNITPLFPFGFGLSYTTFGFSGLTVSAQANGSATVRATVTNTGAKAGAEVPQLYIGQPVANGEPPRQLKGYQKITLTPGQSQVVTFTVTPRDLAHWNGSAWTTNTGSYGVFVGDSSRNLPLTGTIAVTTGS
ncbi:glycoside hydrolase family 3 C-terminal domain-containing protein [Kutzneria sp. 744]|uniref:glycoside hydrolase family 3 C-terminal domain-containing protein n=1 Tax=Kutzneria sp. (strain 744) TaxID=345341 RepID=UPI0003EECF07|nr:glycoside hydrolase family 3 C-terminal domain-containing protein [Kutzneria sp. 744]EWM17345.1 thermostable beta-glucosidase B [Kutzneria sp. 744]